MIGDRLRQARQAQQLSLNTVAARAHISAATLSRIETSKQALGMDLFLMLAAILKVPPEDLLEANGEPARDGERLAEQISDLPSAERTQLWRDLTASRRSVRGRRPAGRREVSSQVDELMAQIDFIREEIASVQRRLKKR
jgi:transcriptional regulator with XRE-family HTH domain